MEGRGREGGESGRGREYFIPTATYIFLYPPWARSIWWSERHQEVLRFGLCINAVHRVK